MKLLSKMILRRNVLDSIQTLCNTRVNYYSTKNLPKELIFFKNDMVITWHPEQNCPYEYTLPLPKVESKISYLKESHHNEAFKVFTKQKTQNEFAEELAKLSYTTKHIWFPRSRDKKAKKTEPDRPYL